MKQLSENEVVANTSIVYACLVIIPY